MLFDLLRFWWRPCINYAFDVINHAMNHVSDDTLRMLIDTYSRRLGLESNVFEERILKKWAAEETERRVNDAIRPFTILVEADA